MKPIVRCSGLDQLIGCPGSRTLITELGCTRGDDSDSHEGSWAHWQAATRLVRDYGAVPPEGGLLRPDIPADYQPASHAERVVDFYCRTVMEDAGADRALEVESELRAEFPNYILSGHCDFSAVNAEATELNLDDLKTGQIPVDPADQNEQILGYAVLFLKQWPSLKKIRARIIQPRLIERPVSEVILEGETLAQAPAFLERRINDALQNPMLLQTGLKNCRWCPAALRCPALKGEIDFFTKLLSP